jgi:hypothetical protein
MSCLEHILLTSACHPIPFSKSLVATKLVCTDSIDLNTTPKCLCPTGVTYGLNSIPSVQTNVASLVAPVHETLQHFWIVPA